MFRASVCQLTLQCLFFTKVEEERRGADQEVLENPLGRLMPTASFKERYRSLLASFLHNIGHVGTTFTLACASSIILYRTVGAPVTFY